MTLQIDARRILRLNRAMRFMLISLALATLALSTAAQAADDFRSKTLSACKTAVAGDKGFKALRAAVGRDITGPFCGCTTDKAQALSDHEKKELLSNNRPSPGLQTKLNKHAEDCINDVLPE